MKNKKRMLKRFFGLALVFAFCGCGAGKGGTPQDGAKEASSEAAAQMDVFQELKEGDEAPDFTAELADGSTFTRSNQAGKVVLLNFWATWCSPCVQEMPAFEKLYGEYGDEVSILAVNCMEDKNTVDRFAADNGYTFPIAYDEQGEISAKYPADGIPYTLLIDGEGVIQKIYVGAMGAEEQYQEYKSAIDEVLGQ